MCIYVHFFFSPPDYHLPCRNLFSSLKTERRFSFTFWNKNGGNGVAVTFTGVVLFSLACISLGSPTRGVL